MDNNNLLNQNGNQDENQGISQDPGQNSVQDSGLNQNQNAEQGQYQQSYQQAYQGYQQPYQGYQQPQQNIYQQPYQGYQGYQQPQNVYQNFQQQQPYPADGSNLEEPVSFADWMVTMLLMFIPCVNIVLMFVWAFSANTNKSKSNYFKAVLVWALIATVLSIIMFAVFGVALASVMSTGTYY